MGRACFSSKTVAVVTGSCRGIGLQIVRQLARHGITTVLTGRNPHRIQQASDLLHQDGLHVLSHLLDVTNPISIQKFASWLQYELGGLDILINNAGVAARGAANSRLVMQTNYYGAKHVTEAMLPLFRPSTAGSRIVNVSSSLARLDWLENEASNWASKLNDIEELSEELIETFVESFLEDENQGKNIQKGWPKLEGVNPPDLLGSYTVSKMALSAYTRMLARDLKNRISGHDFFVNCMCPGYTATDITGKLGHSIEIGADTAVWLALLPYKDCKSGQFFVNRKHEGFVEVPLFLNSGLSYHLAEHRQILLHMYLARISSS